MQVQSPNHWTARDFPFISLAFEKPRLTTNSFTNTFSHRSLTDKCFKKHNDTTITSLNICSNFLILSNTQTVFNFLLSCKYLFLVGLFTSGPIQALHRFAVGSSLSEVSVLPSGLGCSSGDSLWQGPPTSGI